MDTNFQDLLVKAIISLFVLGLLIIAFNITLSTYLGTKVLKQPTIDTKEFTIVGTDKQISTRTSFSAVPGIGAGAATILIPLRGNRVTYTVVLTDENGNTYRTDSQEVYHYSMSNDNVVFDIKEYKGKNYTCFGQSVIKLEALGGE